MKKIIVAAVSLNNVIGANNKIPWYKKEELDYFKNLTIHNAVLMGRKTFKTIGKPLVNRTNLIISQKITDKSKIDNTFYFSSISKAINYASSLYFEKLFIIGGSAIYKQMINQVDELIISKIPIEVEGDKFFPIISDKIWKLDIIEEFPTFKVEKYIKINE